MKFWKWFGDKMDSDLGFALSMVLLGVFLFILVFAIMLHYPWMFYAIAAIGVSYVVYLYRKENR